MKSIQITKQEVRNDKECTPGHQSLSLPNKPVCWPSRDKSLVKLRQSKDSAPFLGRNARHSTRTTPLMTNASTAKLSHYHAIISNWTVIRLCVLLVLLLHWVSIVSGSSMEIDWQDLPRSEDVLRSLKEIGFDLFNEVPRRWIILHPSLEALEFTHTPGVTSDVNPDSAQPNYRQNQAPRYAIDCLSETIRYTLPNDSDMLTKALNELKRITVIKANDVIIKYFEPDTNGQQEKLILLCRLLNMFECRELQLIVDCDKIHNLDKYKDGFDSELCWEEADDTIRFAGSAPFCLGIMSAIPSDLFLTYIFERLVILRRVSQFRLPIMYLPDLSIYLIPLSLSEKWCLEICYRQEKIDIDLKSIQRDAQGCDKVIFNIGHINPPMAVTGLEKVPTEGPTIMLVGSWFAIRYLAIYNKTPINVHALSYDAYKLNHEFAFADNKELPSPSELRVFADRFIYRVSCAGSCDFVSYYKELLAPKSFAKYGISVESVEFEYAYGRDDFFLGLESLCKIQALSNFPLSPNNKKIVCLGPALSDPTWELEEPVNINLSNPQLQFACQNIRYTTLSISGYKRTYQQEPGQNLTRCCIELLNKLRSINAQELCISNVHGEFSTNIDFNLKLSQTCLDNSHKFNLNVRTLILDNVDEFILYRMLGCYEFTCSKLTEIHIINHRLANLAIVQILALPMAEKISKLIINGITCLNEVKYFLRRERLKGFSFFDYVNDHNGKETTQKLGLHKLVLAPEPVLFGSYKRALDALNYLNIKMLVPSDKYNLNPPYPDQPYMIDMKGLTYCITTLAALETDLTECQLTQDGPTPTPNITQSDSITKLFLHLRDNEFLTARDFEIIRCWAAYRCKNLTTLWLAKVKLTEQDRQGLYSCKYVFGNLPYLHSVQIEDITPKNGPIVLSFGLCRNLYHQTSQPSESHCTSYRCNVV
ncbi:hypothetical protein NEHOM01_2217 [Nematocida homosporus]|uniref:uncharacterized protein n=1 Tax=Nematocida homosporus TaxID=1912981 RepID=UPI0022211229|nr:uncharacterized protein NEHOM01_2217 [Nematocida homosporus]KAI5187490.1 hypothetical protein NEHOM01_2217 [Nematocida homosporus]